MIFKGFFFNFRRMQVGAHEGNYDRPLTNRSSNSSSAISTFRCLDKIRFSFLIEPGNLGLMGSSFTGCAQLVYYVRFVFKHTYKGRVFPRERCFVKHGFLVQRQGLLSRSGGTLFTKEVIFPFTKFDFLVLFLG